MSEVGYQEATRHVTEGTLERFVAFAAAHGVEDLMGVTEELAAEFLSAVGTDGQLPAAATQHQRRSVLRIFFRVLHSVDGSVRTVALTDQGLSVSVT